MSHVPVLLRFWLSAVLLGTLVSGVRHQPGDLDRWATFVAVLVASGIVWALAGFVAGRRSGPPGPSGASSS